MQFRIRQAGEDGDPRQRPPKLRARFSHGTYCSERAGGGRPMGRRRLIPCRFGAASEWKAWIAADPFPGNLLY